MFSLLTVTWKILIFLHLKPLTGWRSKFGCKFIVKYFIHFYTKIDWFKFKRTTAFSKIRRWSKQSLKCELFRERLINFWEVRIKTKDNVVWFGKSIRQRKLYEKYLWKFFSDKNNNNNWNKKNKSKHITKSLLPITYFPN